MQPLIAQLCQGASAGEAFTQGVGQGGEQALNWVAAFFYTNCTAIMDAFYAFNSNLKSRQPAEAVSYVQKFVEACQELGVGERHPPVGASGSSMQPPPAAPCAPCRASARVQRGQQSSGAQQPARCRTGQQQLRPAAHSCRTSGCKPYSSPRLFLTLQGPA